jgi:hypothetical protein
MNSNVQPSKTTTRVQPWLAVAFAFTCVLATVGSAAAQTTNFPEVPDKLKPPVGNKAFFMAHAFGSQGYTCLPTANGSTAWNPTARPEATLFIPVFGQLVQVITHFTSINANPKDFVPKPVPLSGNATWQSSFDSSKVWAQKFAGVSPGPDVQSCRNTGSIEQGASSWPTLPSFNVSTPGVVLFPRPLARLVKLSFKVTRLTMFFFTDRNKPVPSTHGCARSRAHPLNKRFHVRND